MVEAPESPAIKAFSVGDFGFGSFVEADVDVAGELDEVVVGGGSMKDPIGDVAVRDRCRRGGSRGLTRPDV